MPLSIRKALTCLGLRELSEAWSNDWWVATHMTLEQAAESPLDRFKRAVRQELEMLKVECVDTRVQP